MYCWSPEQSGFLKHNKEAREDRAIEKLREDSAIKIQSKWRSYLARNQYQQSILSDFDNILVSKLEGPQLPPAADVFIIIRRFITQISFRKKDDMIERFERLCRYINKSMETDSTKLSYATLCLQKEKSLPWIYHIKLLLKSCLTILENLRPENHADSISLPLYLHTLIVFTSAKLWGITRIKPFEKLIPLMQKICLNIQGYLVQNDLFKIMRAVLMKGTSREEISVKMVSLRAIIALTVRPLIDSDFSQHVLNGFLTEILSLPALIHHLEKTKLIDKFSSIQVLKYTLQFFEDKNNFHIFLRDMPVTKTLAFVGNIIHLFYIEINGLGKCPSFLLFTNLVNSLLKTIIPEREKSKEIFAQWHELLGWHTPTIDPAQNHNVPLIKKQYHLLWGSKCIKILLCDSLKKINKDFERIEFSFSNQMSTSNIFKRVLVRSSNQKNTDKSVRHWKTLNSAIVEEISGACFMYYHALKTLPQLRLDILTGICYNDNVLYDLWLLITSLGPNCGIKEFLELFKFAEKEMKPQVAMIILFCEAMTHYVTLLDEFEMYSDQKLFKLNDYVMLTYFLNNILYKILNDNILDTQNVTSSQIFIALHTLLICLYRRDCRRNFTPVNHWLIPEIKIQSFVSDLNKVKRQAVILLQEMPHILPHEERVKLFRKFVQNEKIVNGFTESACASPRSALIVIHRDRIVEDGYRQLGELRAMSLKGIIRVRFINQQGLHEAGIDQDGVFKEFLEETIKNVFDPSLNLFKSTSDQRLYPSPISHVQENHLQLFEFVGRMLGKAVYEGIVVDVPFASFFLSQLLGQTHQSSYSCIDELPSLDNELYKSLTFIKHYKEDAGDLNLSFSVDQDVMGKVVTTELHPGGKSRAVSNHNKLLYIHYMAYFHMNTQIREQTQAFNRGFRSIVDPEWLSLFSPPELQRLISGDTGNLNLKDLRKHTQYYGGFHDSHRVIGWLWDILLKDFVEDERKLFLKFVTSCSKPPLLGFAYLEPPFSIRCVEVGDDEDTGDTIGSVIRGFFTIRKKDPLNRLPTSSTCFNLLKLPNYQKKSTLRDKLRYAITSNTGFELS